MADNEQSKIRYDDFIANVRPDPTKPEATIMLSGYVGHGADGQVRIYPDPTLGTWYDMPEADVVHSIPIADSKLGGSYVWVRASAAITPGSAAAPTAAAAPAAAPAQPAAIHPTTTVMPTPATHCFICPPIGQGQNFTPATVCTQQQCVQPTPTADATLATVWCTLVCVTNPTICVPGAPHALAAAAVQPTPTAHQTLATVCQQPSVVFVCTQPNQCIQPTTTVQPTHVTVCTETCPPGTFGTVGIHCIQPTPTANPTPATLCTPPAVCNPQPGGVHPLAAAMIAQPTPTVQQTVATVCTQPAVCQVQHTPATICIQPTTTVQPTHVTVCTETCPPGTFWTRGIVCIPTLPINCVAQTLPNVCLQTVAPQQQPVAAAMMAQPTPTAQQTFATVCTQPAVCQVQHTPATLCTQAAPCLQPTTTVQPTHVTVCTETCPPGTFWTRGIQCIQPTPTANPTPATICTPPGGGLHPLAAAVQPTPSAVNQCGGQGAMPVTFPTFAYFSCAPQCNTNPPMCPAPAAAMTGFPCASPLCIPTPGCMPRAGVFTPYGG